VLNKGIKLLFIAARDTFHDNTHYSGITPSGNYKTIKVKTHINVDDLKFFAQFETRSRKRDLAGNEIAVIMDSLSSVKHMSEDDLYLTSLSILGVVFGEKYREHVYGVGTGINRIH
jgi:hypothetical protein